MVDSFAAKRPLIRGRRSASCLRLLYWTVLRVLIAFPLFEKRFTCDSVSLRARSLNGALLGDGGVLVKTISGECEPATCVSQLDEMEADDDEGLL